MNSGKGGYTSICDVFLRKFYKNLTLIFHCELTYHIFLSDRKKFIWKYYDGSKITNYKFEESKKNKNDIKLK